MDRLTRVQHVVYQHEKADTRFDHIYEKLTWLEANRLKDEVASRNMLAEVKQRLEDSLCSIDMKHKELEAFRVSYES